ncbi:MAG: helix-turn-helix domain-containing protein [Elusimicrobiota bacterium]
MKRKKQEIQFDQDVRKAIESDPEYATEYFEELMQRPLPVQFALLRKFLGMTQEQLARALGLKQTHISRLENVDSDHLLSLYKRAAEKMGSRLAIVPENMTLVPRDYLQKFHSAHL